jgi:hypothetical protein
MQRTLLIVFAIICATTEMIRADEVAVWESAMRDKLWEIRLAFMCWSTPCCRHG